MTLVSIEALASYAPAERLERDRFFVALGAVENEVFNGFARIPTTDSGDPRMCSADAEAMLKAIAEEDWEFFDGVRERYVPKPFDADGVIVQRDDIMTDGDGDRFIVKHIAYYDWGWRVTGDGVDAKGTKCEVHTVPSDCHHVIPTTIESVLRDFAYHVCDLNVADGDIERYADRLRDLFGGDAE
jgi:hypothetical protein